MVKVRTIARYRKAQATLSAFFKPDGLDECLRCWLIWMRQDVSLRKLGIKTQAGLVGDGDGYGDDQDVHDCQLASDTDVAVATDAMVDSLTVQHRWAIYTTYKLGEGFQQWHFKNADLSKVTEDALHALTEKLKKNVCTRNLF